MNAQISIQVKNENWISRCMSIYMSFGLFVKAKVNMFIDSNDANPIVLKANKKPYLFDLEPGAHSIAFTAKSRAGTDKLIGGVMMGMIGMGAGGYGAAVGAKIGSDFTSGLMGHTRVQDNRIDVTLNEGDILRIRIQPKRNGAVKIKVLSE